MVESNAPEGTPAGRTVEPPNEPALPDDGADELDDEDDMVDGATNEGMSVTNRPDADSDDGAIEPEGEE